MKTDHPIQTCVLPVSPKHDHAPRLASGFKPRPLIGKRAELRKGQPGHTPEAAGKGGRLRFLEYFCKEEARRRGAPKHVPEITIWRSWWDYPLSRTSTLCLPTIPAAILHGRYAPVREGDLVRRACGCPSCEIGRGGGFPARFGQGRRGDDTRLPPARPGVSGFLSVERRCGLLCAFGPRRHLLGLAA